jgi:conjugal transfer pilus assembly protein TraE
MNITIRNQKILSLFTQNMGLTTLVGALLLSNIILSSALLCKREKITLVPRQFDRAFSIQGENVSSEQLELMGRDIAMLLLDISPSSYAYKHKALLEYVAPQSYGALKKRLFKDGEHYNSLQLSTNFKPTQIIANPDALVVEVKGNLTSYVGEKMVHSSLETLTLKFTQSTGILLLESVSGGEPHDS